MMLCVKVVVIRLVLVYALLKSTTAYSADIVFYKSYRHSLFSSYTMFHCASSNRTNETALIWMDKTGEYVEETNRMHIKYICQIRKSASCIRSSFIQEGTFKNSLEEFGGIVLDRRWEDFPVIYTYGTDVERLATISNENFAFAFSIRIAKNGFLYICDSYYPWSAKNCYSIVIGGWGNTKIGLRKCIKGELFKQYYSYPTGGCNQLRAEVKGTQLLSILKWNHFIIEKRDNQILMYRYGYSNPILKFTDNNPFHATHVMIRSEEYGYWKLHNYNYYAVNTAHVETAAFPINSSPVCIKVYVKPCSECNIQVILQKDFNKEAITSSNLTKNSEWQALTLYSKAYSSDLSLQLAFKSNGPRLGSYFIGDIIDCTSQERHEIQTNFDSICCYPIKYDINICPDVLNNKINLEADEDHSCPTNTFGKSCIPCGEICRTNEKFCEISSTNQVQCNCYNGYNGTNCDKLCSKGYYGAACKKQCSLGCKVCDPTEGCKECKEHIDGPQDNCSRLHFPVLINKPKIISVDYENVDIEVNFTYSGINTPDSYEIEVWNTKLGTSWEKKGSTHKFPSEIKNIQRINTLSSNTLYILRIILLSNGEKETRSEFIQTQEFQTKCKDIIRDDVTFSIYGSSLNVYVNTSDKSCSLENFKISYGIFEIPLIINHTFPLKNCENYTITISRNGSKWNDYNIRTGEDGQDLACVVVNVTSTTATISWDPLKNISNYIVSYEYFGSLYNNCIAMKTGYKTINVEGSKVHITNLKPYSKYKVYIRTENRQTVREELIHTTSTENIDLIEIQKPIYTQSSNLLNITTAINCNAIRGPLNISIRLECLSSWCANDASNNEPIRKNSEQFHFRVKGFSDYKVEIRARRDKIEVVSYENHTTNATAPGPVTDLVIYSKTNKNLSLRWKPPYPSMGNLSYYIFECRSGSYCRLTLSKNDTSCKIWENYHCVTIPELNYNRLHTVSVQAVNYPNLVGTSNTATTITRQEAPFSPSFLKLSWDSSYERLNVIFPHPNITNGPLIGFILSGNQKDFKTEMIKEENKTYSTSIEMFPFATKINIYVAVFNQAGKSPNINNVTYTPPPTPQLNTRNIRISPNITNVVVNLHDIPLPQKHVSCLIAIVVTKISTTSQLNLDSFSAEDRKIIEESKVPEYYTSWVAWKALVVSKKENLTLSIGDDNSSTNRVLLPNTEYNITIFIRNSFQGKHKYLVWSQMTKTLASEAGDFNLLLLLILLIFPVLCICIFLLRSRRITINLPNFTRTRERSNEGNNLMLQAAQPFRLRPKPTLYQNIEEAMEDIEFSKPVKVSELEKYIKESLANGEFERQHALFPRGQTKPWYFGTKPENKVKNRYVNLAAYDHSRVRLNIINKDRNSEYINANYIDGYKCEKAFIATQGPKVNTLNDFWRMIWEKQVEYIVMIANLVEGGKKKVAKYWPDINETLSFGEISVKYISVTVFANYEERIFSVSSEGERRTIIQLHFVSWPDHGVPIYAQSLAPFLKRILVLPQSPTAPIVVHCSAGVGRTGTLILADICLRMAAREGYVNVLYYQHKLREQRPNMVDNVEQYKLVHLLLLHCLIAPDTSMICTENMDILIEELLASNEINKQMKYLEESSWQDEAMNTTASKVTLPVVYEKNRFNNFVPDEHSRIILTAYPPTDESSMYINAVKVNDFHHSGKFVVTQYPLKNSVGDFWRLIVDQEITIAICLNELCLNDNVSDVFFPSEQNMTLTPVPYLKINLISSDEGATFNTYILDVLNLKKKSETLKFTLVQLKSWTYDQLCPATPMFLVTLFQEMNRIGKNAERILISCYDGVRASGLYTAFCVLIEQIKLEQTCDVCLAVRTVRHSRKEFVTEVEQFRFLYLCALQYVKTFEMYSNFK